MIEKKIIVSGYAEEIRGKPTLAKVVNDYFYENKKGEAISAPWKAESTRRQYINDIVRRLVPNMDNYTPLEDYTQEDVVKAMRKIQKAWDYDEVTMAHYKLLFWRIYKAGVENGLYEDNLHWEELEVVGRNQNNISAKRKLAVQRRTLSVKDEMKLLAYFANLDPETTVGEDYGLLLMYVIPLRNQEAAALDFGDFRMYTEEKIPSIYVYKSSGTNTSKVKGGGKTSNMFRILPVLDFAGKLIEIRKEFVQKEITDRPKNIDSLPIVCKGLQLDKRCSTADISRHARKIFDQLGIGKDALDEATRQLYVKSGIEEDSATSYLLRRNALNHLWCLAFERSELEYCMGHVIESNDVKRNDFTNEEEFIKLKQKLDNHPARLYFSKSKKEVVIEDEIVRSMFGSRKEFILPIGTEENTYIFECIANEAEDNLIVNVEGEAEVVVHKSYVLGCEKKENIDITDLIKRRYSNETKGAKIGKESD